MSGKSVERSALPLQLEIAVQKIHKVYSSLLCRRIQASSSGNEPQEVAHGGDGSALSSLFDISEAYRQAVVPLGDNEGSGFWALLSLLLCFWEESSCHPSLSNGAVTHTPLKSLNIAPTMQRWYRANVFNFSCALEELEAFQPSQAAQEVLEEYVAGEESGAKSSQTDRALLLMEILVRLMMCGAFELAAVVYDRLVIFFRCCEQLQEERRITGTDAVHLTAEMESCFAAVKRLLLIPVAEDESAAGLEAPFLAKYSSQHKVGRSTIDPSAVRGIGGGYAVFTSPSAHKEWQTEANNLVYTTKRTVGDWIHRPPRAMHGEQDDDSAGNNDVAAAGGVVSFLFRQFCLVTLDTLLMMSGDALLMEQTCIESELSLMGYLVGMSTLCQPFMTMRELRLLLEDALQQGVWQESLQIDPGMVSNLWTSSLSRCGEASGDSVEDRSPSSQNPAWQYFLLWRVLGCESLVDVPGALRTSVSLDIQPSRYWKWDPIYMFPRGVEESDNDDDEEEDEFDEEEDDHSTGSRFPPEVLQSLVVRQSIRRFVVSAMCAFVADLTAIPLSLNSSTTLDSVPSPEILIHRYTLLDDYLNLLRSPDSDAHAPAVRFSSPTLWPIQLTLALASPLHNPETLYNVVMDVARLDLCGNTSAGMEFNSQSYHRLLSFLCAGSREVPPPIDPEWMTVPASRNLPIRYSRSSLVSWHPQSPLQTHVFAILEYFACSASAGAEEEEEDEEEEGHALPQSGTGGDSFQVVARQWKHRREEVRQQAIRDLHGYVVDIAVQKGWSLPTPAHSSSSLSGNGEESARDRMAGSQLSCSTSFTSTPLILGAWLTRRYSFISADHLTTGMQRVAPRPTLSSRFALLQKRKGIRDGRALGYHCGCTPALELLISALRIRLTSPFLMEHHALEVKILGDAVEHQFISSCPILNASGNPQDELDAECSALLEAYSRIAVVLRRTAVLETVSEQNKRLSANGASNNMEEKQEILALHVQLIDSIVDLFRAWDTSSSANVSSAVHSTASAAVSAPHTLQSYCLRTRLHPRVQYMLIQRALESLLLVRTLLKEGGKSLLQNLPVNRCFDRVHALAEIAEEEEEHFWFLLASAQLPFFCRAFEMTHVGQWNPSISSTMHRVQNVDVFSASKSTVNPSFDAVNRCIAADKTADGFHPPNCVERDDREENIRRLLRIIAES